MIDYTQPQYKNLYEEILLDYHFRFPKFHPIPYINDHQPIALSVIIDVESIKTSDNSTWMSSTFESDHVQKSLRKGILKEKGMAPIKYALFHW